MISDNQDGSMGVIVNKPAIKVDISSIFSNSILKKKETKIPKIFMEDL